MLSKRESQIIEILVLHHRKSREQIADKLGIAVTTLDKHIYNIYKKLGINNIISLMVIYYNAKLLLLHKIQYRLIQVYQRLLKLNSRIKIIKVYKQIA